MIDARVFWEGVPGAATDVQLTRLVHTPCLPRRARGRISLKLTRTRTSQAAGSTQLKRLMHTSWVSMWHIGNMRFWGNGGTHRDGNKKI